MNAFTASQLQELLDDADGHHRMSDWEDGFLADLRWRLARDPAMPLSDKQIAALRRIEAKVYAT